MVTGPRQFCLWNWRASGVLFDSGVLYCTATGAALLELMGMDLSK